MPATYLDRIVAAHRAAAGADSRAPERLIDEARAVKEPTRGFASALRPAGPALRPAGSALRPAGSALRPAGSGQGHSRRENGEISVIAEFKRASPSLGPIAPDLDPARVASVYKKGGAACLSVLTDHEFFSGSPADLKAARAASGLPVLRKDFTVSAADVCEARLMGADAVLLIVAALEPGELKDCIELAGELGLDALVEVHDTDEVDIALAAGARIVGVNQRDLHTFAVDTDRAVRVGQTLPAEVVRVAESGIKTATDVGHLADAGYDAILVGESLMTSSDPAAAVAELRAGATHRPAPGKGTDSAGATHGSAPTAASATQGS